MVLGAAATLVLFWTVNDRPAFVYLRTHVEEPVARGREIYATFQQQVFRSCPTKFQRILIDSAGRVFELSTSDTPGGTPTVRTVTYGSRGPVPLDAALGWGVYTVRAWSMCNPVQRWFPVMHPPAEMPVLIVESETESGS